MEVSLRGLSEVVKLLLRIEVNTKIKNNDDRTIPDYVNRKDLKVVDLLMKYEK